jgi:hypothetical protein
MLRRLSQAAGFERCEPLPTGGRDALIKRGHASHRDTPGINPVFLLSRDREIGWVDGLDDIL